MVNFVYNFPYMETAEFEALKGEERDTGNAEKKHLKIHKTEIVYIFLIAVGAAFLGWIIENIVRMISVGIIDNRYHVLPFIAPYGFAIFAMYIMLETPDDVSFFGIKIFKKPHKWQKFLNHIVYIAIVSGFVFAGELLVGSFYEWVTGLSLWDYSDLPLHFTKYAGLIPALGYGIMAYIMMLFFKPCVNFLKKHFTYKTCLIVAWVMSTLVICDNIIMIIMTLVTDCKPIYWQICIRSECEMGQYFSYCV